MDTAKQWTVVIDIDEHEGRTRAVARLHTRDTEKLVGVGLARLNPAESSAVRRSGPDVLRRCMQHVLGQLR